MPNIHKRNLEAVSVYEANSSLSDHLTLRARAVRRGSVSEFMNGGSHLILGVARACQEREIGVVDRALY